MPEEEVLNGPALAAIGCGFLMGVEKGNMLGRQGIRLNIERLLTSVRISGCMCLGYSRSPQVGNPIASVPKGHV